MKEHELYSPFSNVMVIGQSRYLVYIDETRNIHLRVVGKPLEGGCVTGKETWQKNMKTDFKNVSCEDDSWVEMEHDRV
jgi:hypothetical protein